MAEIYRPVGRLNLLEAENAKPNDLMADRWLDHEMLQNVIRRKL